MVVVVGHGDLSAEEAREAERLQKQVDGEVYGVDVHDCYMSVCVVKFSAFPSSMSFTLQHLPPYAVKWTLCLPCESIFVTCMRLTASLLLVIVERATVVCS